MTMFNISKCFLWIKILDMEDWGGIFPVVPYSYLWKYSNFPYKDCITFLVIDVLLMTWTHSCRGYFSGYYYDYEEEQCKKFIYGGCRGNANNKNKAKCVKACYKLYFWWGIYLDNIPVNTLITYTIYFTYFLWFHNCSKICQYNFVQDR